MAKFSPRLHRLAPIAGLILMLVLAGCAPAPSISRSSELPTPTLGAQLGPELPPTSLPGGAPPATVAAAQPASRPVPPKVGDAAYDFELYDLMGGKISLSSLRGKSVMLNFWASWCGPCRAEIPHMIDLYDELAGQEFEILAVNLREDPERVQAFVDEMAMQFPVVLDATGTIGNAYFVRGIPTSIFVDKEGLIQIVHTGTLTDEQLRQYVAKLMQ